MADRTCSVEGCERQVEARGWCRAHYNRWKRKGTVAGPPVKALAPRLSCYGCGCHRRSLDEWCSPFRLVVLRWLVDRAGNPTMFGCWTHDGFRTSKGYAGTSVADRRLRMNRVAVAASGRLLGDGVADHLCRNRACFNPLHLEVVSHAENTLRGQSFSAANAAKTHCFRGHPLSGDNLSIKDGRRICVACRAEWKRNWRQKRTAAA